MGGAFACSRFGNGISSGGGGGIGATSGFPLVIFRFRRNSVRATERKSGSTNNSKRNGSQRQVSIRLLEREAFCP